MPLNIKRRKDRGGVYYYSGTIAGHRLRGSTGTTDRDEAARVASKIETKHRDSHTDEPQEVLTFPQAVALYLKAEKPAKYLAKIVAYWKDTLVKTMTAGAIKQSAIDLYPDASGATRNRQVITPTLAVINHCASLELCGFIRMNKGARFKFTAKIKTPITVAWLDAFCAHARPLTSALALTMFGTACRINEAIRLEWRDIDFNERTILIRDSKTRKERLAHMQDRLLVALANLPRDDKPFPYSESQLRRFWDEDIAITAESIVGFERLTFHSARHGFATKMLRDGTDPKTAAEAGGWDDITLFMETYAHAIGDRRVTDGIFGTKLAPPKIRRRKNNGL
jgi:integrase